MSLNNGLTARIDQLRRMGMGEQIICDRLVLEGWGAEAVVEAIRSDRDPALPPPEQRQSSLASPQQDILPVAPHHAPEAAFPTVGESRSPTRTRSFPYIALAAAVILGVAGLSAYILRPPAVYSISVSSSHSTSTPGLSFGPLPRLSDPDFYKEVTAKLTQEKASFIDANLSDMRLVVYQRGEVALQVPILAKGKAGSWWETPAGIYKIETKEKSHFSSFGHVYQPYSLDFQGNFFIHGWPYYENGTPVSSSYSGGCIRLSTDNAQKVFDLASIGMPVVVYNTNESNDAFTYELKAPTISASSYLAADVKNGTVLIGKNISDPAPIASITKLVTALVATEYLNLENTIVVPQNAIVYTSKPRLRAGQSVRVYDLLFLLLLESSNEAAKTLASYHGEDQFVSFMNKKALAMNLRHTVFVDPSGSGERNVSTPEDLFQLLRYIGDNRRFVFGITSGRVIDSAYGTPSFKNIDNYNRVPNADGTLVGGKVGQTNAAGDTYAGVFKIRIGREDRDIAIIVLGSRDEYSDVQRLASFVKDMYAGGTDSGQQSSIISK